MGSGVEGAQRGGQSPPRSCKPQKAKCHSFAMARESEKGRKGIQGKFNMKKCRIQSVGQKNLLQSGSSYRKHLFKSGDKS